MSTEKKAAVWGLLRRQEHWTLSARGWLVLCVAGLGVFMLALLGVHPFLAVNAPVQAEYLVLEGWLPDYAEEVAVLEFKGHPYQYLFTTGCPLEHGFYLSEYATYAQLAAANLREIGLGPPAVVAVPAYVKYRDRTYASALALKKWLRDHGLTVKALNIVTLGAHARRTRLLYAKAFPDLAIGVIAVENREYKPRHWWKSSAGFRDVIGEGVAYLYARFLFHAGA